MFTLYDGPEHPFIHALDTGSGSALCYELPSSLRAKARQLRVRLGAQKGLVDVTERDVVVAQIAEPTSVYGPSIRMPGSDRPPVGTP